VSGPPVEWRSGESRINSLCSLANRSDRRVLRTPAITEDEVRWFTDRGFSVVQTLVMLERDCRHDDEWSDDVTQLSWRRLKSRRRDELTASMLELDGEAFSPPWNFSRDSLEAACSATDEHVVLVSGEGRSPVAGFAIVGRSAHRAYLQRLAVRRDVQRRGVGTLLVRHALAWANHRGATTLAVNTEPSNEAALALYRRLRFVTVPEALHVLERPVN